MHPLPELPDGRLEQRFEASKPAYSEAEALAEAHRCLYCADAPCVKACPTSIDIPTFIHKISTHNIAGAARTIFKENLLGASCARVCPVDVLCAGACVYEAWGREPIAIGRLQRYATETALSRQSLSSLLPTKKRASGKSVALVGAGPASIAAAGLLALEGHRAVVFEKRAIPGGLNTLGIAPYKQSADQALEELDWLLRLGDIELVTGCEIVAQPTHSRQKSARELLDNHAAVFLGLGLGSDSPLGVPGEAGPGVMGAVALVEAIKADPSLRLNGVNKAMVVGGGNTAIDVAHELRLLGVEEVTMAYRRSEKEMSGYAHELAQARTDGVRLLPQVVVTAVIRDEAKALKAVRLARASAGKPIEGSEEIVPIDLLAVAIGQSSAAHVAQAFGAVEIDAKGRVVVEPRTQRTRNPRVWAGGDCVNGGKEVVNAVEEAKRAVNDMLKFLGGR